MDHFSLYGSLNQNKGLGFTLPPQRSLLVSRLFSAIPIPCLKILFFNHSSLCSFFLIHSWIRLYH